MNSEDMFNFSNENCDFNNENDEFKENISKVDKIEGITQRSKTSRLSILSSLDPYYSSEKNIKNSPDLPTDNCAVKVVDNEIIQDANQSFNLLHFDTSDDKLYSDEEIKTPTKNLQNMDFMSPKNSTHSFNKLDISMMLDESLENSDVSTENLIGLSPIQKLVDKSTLDNFIKYHKDKKQSWLEKEKHFEDVIDSLKKDCEAKIQELLIENEENLEKMRVTHLNMLAPKQKEKDDILAETENHLEEMKDYYAKTLAEKQIGHDQLLAEKQIEHDQLLAEKQIEHDQLLAEYDINMDKLRTDHEMILYEKQKDQDQLIKDMEILLNELTTVGCDRATHLIICDQYSDTLLESTKQYEELISKLHHDNKDLESLLERYIKKIEKYQGTIDALQKNQVILTAQIEEDKISLAKLKANVYESEQVFANTQQSNDEEVSKMRKDYDTKVFFLESKWKYHANAESILKEELSLRTRERDQLSDHLNELLKQI